MCNNENQIKSEDIHTMLCTLQEVLGELETLFNNIQYFADKGVYVVERVSKIIEENNVTKEECKNGIDIQVAKEQE